MKKENFICPCCGLPNHLEFKSRADYDSYLVEHEREKFNDFEHYQFDRYILEEEESEDNRREEIWKRFELIKDYWNKYSDFNSWFLKELVGFLSEKEIVQEMTDEIFNDQLNSNQEQEDGQNDNVQSGENVSP